MGEPVKWVDVRHLDPTAALAENGEGDGRRIEARLRHYPYTSTPFVLTVTIIVKGNCLWWTMTRSYSTTHWAVRAYQRKKAEAEVRITMPGCP